LRDIEHYQQNYMFRITLKNYRCFSDQSPASIDFDKGFTAFIGTNNSGKSSFLRFFLEFRPFFQSLQNGFPGAQQLSFNLSQVEDWVEIFNNENLRDITIEISTKKSAPNEVDRVLMTLSRNRETVAQIGRLLRTNHIGLAY
jgi:predicted ATP-dependent endonuclease of OLD family